MFIDQRSRKEKLMSHTKDFDIKRNAILDCAEQLFTVRGYEVTTVNTILKEVGIGQGTF